MISASNADYDTNRTAKTSYFQYAVCHKLKHDGRHWAALSTLAYHDESNHSKPLKDAGTHFWSDEIKILEKLLNLTLHHNLVKGQMNYFKLKNTVGKWKTLHCKIRDSGIYRTFW